MRTWLFNIRKREGKTQKAVADAVGISQPHYANIERGRRGLPMNPLIAQRIGKELNFDWNLFYLETDCREKIYRDAESPEVSHDTQI